mmetsp:Transcript_1982/g.7277  ORF Transcript_1982/g.7277 Transcript_1982/m.7277 type:complete len:163 (+) Transcript_1982:280-768(+)
MIRPMLEVREESKDCITLSLISSSNDVDACLNDVDAFRDFLFLMSVVFSFSADELERFAVEAVETEMRHIVLARDGYVPMLWTVHVLSRQWFRVDIRLDPRTKELSLWDRRAAFMLAVRMLRLRLPRELEEIILGVAFGRRVVMMNCYLSELFWGSSDDEDM